MVWLFRLFFGMIGIAVALWLYRLIRTLLSPEETVKVVLREKRRECIPQTIVSVRKDITEYNLVFCTEGGRMLHMKVSEAVYGTLEQRDVGYLTHRGDWFQSFQKDSVPISCRDSSPV